MVKVMVQTVKEQLDVLTNMSHKLLPEFREFTN